MLIDGLVPGEGLTLFHAQPRALKTWCSLECGLALATGTPALGVLPVPTAVPVLYVTNEDAWQVVGRRLDALLRGRSLTTLPQPFGFAIHAGVWLDEPQWQVRLVARIKDVGYRVVIFDPLRSLSGCVDQGPRELQPLARYLRQLIDATGVVPLLSHHDVKPLLGQRDTRQRPQRASGGGVFSIADAPIAFERLSDQTPAVTLVVPTLWKIGETPPALRVRLSVDAAGARLTATTVAAADVSHVALDDQILSTLQAHTELSTRAIAAMVQAHRTTVTSRLEHLSEAEKVDSRPGARNAVLWFARGAE